MQLQHGKYKGRLLMPVYYNSDNGGESAALVYSDDDGKTWHRGESPKDTASNNSLGRNKLGWDNSENQVIEMKNGTVVMFSRSNSGLVHAVSKDGGETWEDEIHRIPIKHHGGAMVGATKYVDKDGVEYVLISNPDGPARSNGSVKYGKLNEDGSVDWIGKKQLNNTAYAYSALTEIEPGKFGILYEEQKNYEGTSRQHLMYTEFDWNWLTSKEEDYVELPQESPKLLQVDSKIEDKKVTLLVKFDKEVYNTGQAELVLTYQDKEIKANYIDGSSTKTLRFEAELEGDEKSKLTAKNLKNVAGYLTNVDGKDLEDIEINKLIKDFSIISRDKYQGASASSSHNGTTEGGPHLAIDDKLDTWWHTDWSNGRLGDLPKNPEHITLELKEKTEIDKLSYVPRPGNMNGNLKDYLVYISTDGEEFTEVAKGSLGPSLDAGKSAHEILFDPVEAKFVKLEYHSSYGSQANNFASAVEINLHYADPSNPREILDTSKLQEKVNEIKAKELAKYLNANSILSVLNDAERWLSDNSNKIKTEILEKELEDFITLLDSRLKALIKELDTSDLQEKLKEAKKVDTSGKTDDSIDRLNKSIKKAENWLNIESYNEEIHYVKDPVNALLDSEYYIKDNELANEQMKDLIESLNTAVNSLENIEEEPEVPGETDKEEPGEIEKEVETPEETEKEVETPEETEKEVETPEETEKEVETPKETEKEVETPKETEKEVETPKETEKEVETPEETEKEVETPKETEEDKTQPGQPETPEETKEDQIRIEVTDITDKEKDLFGLHKDLEAKVKERYKDYQYKIFDIKALNSKKEEISNLDEKELVKVNLKDLNLDKADKLSLWTIHEGELIEVTDFEIKGDEVEFMWDRFSKFAFVKEVKKDEKPLVNQTSQGQSPQSQTTKPSKGPKTGDAGIAMMSVMLLASIGAYVVSSSKKKN